MISAKAVRFTRLEERCSHIIARLYCVRMLHNRQLSRKTEQGQFYIFFIPRKQVSFPAKTVYV